MIREVVDRAPPARLRHGLRGDPQGRFLARAAVRDREAYRHQEVVKRLLVLGAVLAFVLVCLAAVSGYIRADEATKGYYTTRLRLAAAAGVGAAGVIVDRWLV